MKMTSQEIHKIELPETLPSTYKTLELLKEIAYQLAKLNENWADVECNRSQLHVTHE